VPWTTTLKFQGLREVEKTGRARDYTRIEWVSLQTLPVARNADKTISPTNTRALNQRRTNASSIFYQWTFPFHSKFIIASALFLACDRHKGVWQGGFRSVYRLHIRISGSMDTCYGHINIMLLFLTRFPASTRNFPTLQNQFGLSRRVSQPQVSRPARTIDGHYPFSYHEETVSPARGALIGFTTRLPLLSI